MEQDQSGILQTFDLHQNRVLLSRSHPYYHFILPGERPLPNEKSTPPNIVEVDLKLTLHQGLNRCLKPQAQLVTVWLKSLRVDIRLVTREGDYCFGEMGYYMFLEVKSNRTDTLVIRIQNVEQELRMTSIGVKVYLHRIGNTIGEAELNRDVTTVFGSQNPRETMSCEISNFKVTTLHTSKQPQIGQLLPNRFKFKDEDYSLPIGVFNHYQQFYDSLGITTNVTLEELEKQIQAVPPYESRPLPVENKLYICHDMKGGYKEDLFFDHNIAPNGDEEHMAYRCLHLEQSEIFNYFSHHNISVPPKHWRVLCQRYKTQCLGTFITEREDYNENILTSKEFALFLVGVARKCKFDGYLINIERKVSTISAFKKWLEYFTLKMHQFVPNSSVIWYDSIRARDGVVEYQNCLSRENYEFYQITDGLFTNYWWDENRLKDSVQMKGDNKRKVYIGNDCFGRNTYGGGKMDIYKAANKILQYKQALSIGLFAPGYTYEVNGSRYRKLFWFNECALYKGVSNQTIPLYSKEWKENKPKRDCGGWEKQNAETVSSFGRNERSIKIGLQNVGQNQLVRLIFICHVKGTPPVKQSPYKIILQVVDRFDNVAVETDVYNFFDYRKTTDEPELVTKEIDYDPNILGNQQQFIRVIIIAQSKEHWAGFYGPRFSSELAAILNYEKEKHWIGKMPINQAVIGQNYHSYCNLGYGSFFYYQGFQLQGDYNYLADMDIPHTHVINHPLDTELDYEQCFMGGTSLIVKKQTIKLLKVVIPASVNLADEYYLVLTVRNTHGITATLKYMSKNEEDRVFNAKLMKTDEMGEWKRFTFKLLTTLKSLKADVRSIIELKSLKFPYNLGEIKLVKGRKEFHSINCVLSASKDMVPSDKYYLNLTVSSQAYRRLYVMLHKVGMFTYFDSGVARLRNIPIEKCDSFEIQIIDTDESLEENTLRHKAFDALAISELVFKGSITF